MQDPALLPPFRVRLLWQDSIAAFLAAGTTQVAGTREVATSRASAVPGCRLHTRTCRVVCFLRTFPQKQTHQLNDVLETRWMLHSFNLKSATPRSTHRCLFRRNVTGQVGEAVTSLGSTMAPRQAPGWGQAGCIHASQGS